MKYISTRGNYEPVTSAEAIRLGMVPEGGLFVPQEVPLISLKQISQMVGQPYKKIAQTILKKYLTDYSNRELEQALDSAYNEENFNHPEMAPLVQLEDNMFILELWHGPTAAFKDMALQLMPYLLVEALKKQEIEDEIVILVATSGDTGKAALEGFRGIEGVNIIVFYPDQGVSKVQETQMLTTKGDNT
ncbi:MAG: threonine synthase, partial [Bacillota bacterium]